MEQENFNYDFEQMRMLGRKQVYHTMAAAVVGNLLNLRKSNVRESFSNFRDAEHRLEKVAMIGGIEFINDSKATNVNSTWYALESINKPVVWIAGGMGVETGKEILRLVPLVEKKVKTLIVLAKDVKQIHEAFSRKVSLIIKAGNMSEAVELAYRVSDKGDCILLSPACASFDMFEDYQDRGRAFKKAVKLL